jgi:1-phosphofructokinase family hexose kinase
MKIVIASLNPAIERLLVVPRNVPGTVHRLTRSETLAGGKGVNVARVLRQLGTAEFAPFAADPSADPVEPLLVGPLGGPTGELWAALLESEGLAVCPVPTAGWTRTNEVLIDESAPEDATVYNDAGPKIDDRELKSIRHLAFTTLQDSVMLVCTGSLPPGLPANFYGEWLAAARTRGIRTLLDAHGSALARGAEAAPTIVKVNRDELHELAEASNSTDDDLVATWLALGTEAVIVTDGSAPTLATTVSQTFEVESPRVQTRSAVGSGDAYTAGLVWSVSARPEADWPAHLTLAAACGASNATSILARLAAEHPPSYLLDQVVVREKASER